MTARAVALLIALTALLAAAGPASAAVPGVAADARAAGLGRIAGVLEESALPALRLDRQVLRTEPAALGTTRLGGAPDLPSGRRWPRCDGKLMTFVAQVRLADLPPSELPATGLLSIFAHVETEPGVTDYGLYAGPCARVLHTADGVPLARRAVSRKRVRLRPATFVTRTETSLLTAPYGDLVTARGTVRLTSAEDERLRKLVERYEPVTLDRAAGQWGPHHKLLGHASWSQAEPRATCAERRIGAGTRLLDWRHLLQLDYDMALGFEVADAGRLNVMVPAGDLARGASMRACAAFESS